MYINPIPTRLCYVIYCCGDKSYPCLEVGIGLIGVVKLRNRRYVYNHSSNLIYSRVDPASAGPENYDPPPNTTFECRIVGATSNYITDKLHFVFL